MAQVEKLTAEISIQDNATRQLDRIVGSIEKQTAELLKMQRAGDNAGKGMDRMTKSVVKQNNDILRLKATLDKTRNSTNKKMDVKVDTKQAVHNVDRLKTSMRDATTGSMNMVKSLKGIGTAVIGAGATIAGLGYVGKQAFDATFVPAAEYEMNQKMIQAMFNDAKKSKIYMESMQNMALTSPLLNSADIFSNSKSFISTSKNQEQLNKMWDLTERLLAVDPKQGVDGAVLALKELFSGDTQSLVERFELSRKTLNDIKNLPLGEQLRALDKYFKKMGMTKKLVNEMGNTTLGVWNQIKETTQVGLRQIGDPAVKIVKPMLDDLNRALQTGKANNLIKFGQQMASGIAKGFVGVSRKIGGIIDGLMKNPEFDKLSVQGKVKFVIEDIGKRFTSWFEKSGRSKMEDAARLLVETGAAGITASQEPIVTASLSLGKAIGKGILDGAKNYLAENWKSIITQTLTLSPITVPIKVSIDTGLGWANKLVNGGNTRSQPTSKPIKTPTFNKTTKPKNNPLSKYKLNAFGLNRVPYNNYPALLHEGERVQTKQQANQADKKKSTPGVNINVAKMEVRNESDIKKVALELARLLEREGGLMA